MTGFALPISSPLAGEDRLGLETCFLASLGEGGGATRPLQLQLGSTLPSFRILSRKGRGRIFA